MQTRPSCAPSRNALLTGSRCTSLGIYNLHVNFRSVVPDAGHPPATLQESWISSGGNRQNPAHRPRESRRSGILERADASRARGGIPRSGKHARRRADGAKKRSLRTSSSIESANFPRAPRGKSSTQPTTTMPMDELPVPASSGWARPKSEGNASFWPSASSNLTCRLRLPKSTGISTTRANLHSLNSATTLPERAPLRRQRRHRDCQLRTNA